MSFRPGGMSDSDDSEDDFYFSGGHQTTAKPIDPPKVDQSQEVLEAEYKHLYYYNSALKGIHTDSGGFDELEAAWKAGIDVNEVKDKGWTFLHYACKEARPDIIRHLLEKGANVNQISEKDGFPPFLALCSSEKRDNITLIKECLDLLVSKGATLSLTEYRGITPVMYAAKEGLEEFVILFLDLGIDVNRQDHEGMTALHMAAERGYGRVVRTLLQYGANVDVLDQDGHTAYDSALSKQFVQLASDLYNVQTTKWIPGSDPSLLKEMRDPDPDKPRTLTHSQARLLRPQRQFIEMTLAKIGLEDLIPIFNEHKIDFLGLLRLTDDDLQCMGIKEVGNRHKILDTIRVLHNTEWNKSSVNSLFLQGNITSPEVVCMLNDIKVHLEFMTQSMIYLQKRLKAEPKALISGSECTRAPQLVRYTNAAISATEALKVQALALTEVFSEAETSSNLKIGDMVEKRTGKMKWYLSAVFLISAILVTPKLRHFIHLK